MEPLKVLEIDSGGGEVQLRSQNPTARQAERGYYEMRLFRQGMLRMQRFANPHWVAIMGPKLKLFVLLTCASHVGAAVG